MRDRDVARSFAFMIVGTLALLVAWTSAIAQQPTPIPTPTPSNALPKPPVHLHAGEYVWMAQLAPKGPIVIIVSLPEQLAYVYRNGVRIAVSTVSTGKRGYETLTSVFTILQKVGSITRTCTTTRRCRSCSA